MTDNQTSNHQLARLVETWRNRSRKLFMCAEKEKLETSKSAARHAAMCYFNASEELNEAIKPNKIQVAAGELMPLVQAINDIPDLSRKISPPNTNCPSVDATE